MLRFFHNAGHIGVSGKPTPPKDVIIQNDNPFIYFHGRWDRSPGTWWAGSGFKLNVDNLSSLTLNLGNHTTTSGIRWRNNRIDLETVTFNPDAQLLPYTPSKLAFQFIGDSLSAGQYLPQGVDQAWPFLTGEFFKAEHTVNAQPGAALSDIVSYGNEHGMSFQFFRTEDTGYFYTTDHNYTTPWDFSRDIPAPTHVVIHLGANDAGQNVTADSFVETYLGFLEHPRTIYRTQPILIFTPWGCRMPMAL
ncbi:hypothetical protein A0H81_05564 [Grifola frondosa]|uniref:SGNH hydrolase-type esterase domain-containing protein n=1 Tax=Grifola frondosa TaxID=5627 RepID=A0A1C7MDH1_GRIFR|nr:hypothetical protein A0H81_05564 [Grifola frondosa]